MDKLFHTTLYWTCDYLSMLGLKLIHVSERGSWSWYHYRFIKWNYKGTVHRKYKNITISMVPVRKGRLEHGSSWGQHGAHLGPVGPRWAPCWPHEPCYHGIYVEMAVLPFRSNICHCLHQKVSLKSRHAIEILNTGTGNCRMTTSGVASDEYFLKMTTFPFQRIQVK